MSAISLYCAIAFLLGAVLMLGLRLRQVRQVNEQNADRFANCINELSRRTGGSDMLQRRHD